MKKTIMRLFFFLALGVCCVTILCPRVFAFPPDRPKRHFASSYEEYDQILKEENVPFAFVKYKAIQELGEFRAFSSDLDFDKYEYELAAKGTNGESMRIIVSIKHMDWHAEPPAFSDDIYKECSLSRVLDFPHMALLDVSDMDPVIPGRNEDWWNPVAELRGPYPYWHYYVRADNMTYVYDYTGNLTQIQFCSNGLDVSISGSFENLPDGVADTDTLMGMALDYNQGRAAARHLAFKMTKQRWPLIVIIGTIVLVVSAFAICFVMRKKCGAPAPAMAGAPAGEVLAGSNEDVSAAPSGAAPAAPESPTPPEEDTKTDDFDRS